MARSQNFRDLSLNQKATLAMALASVFAGVGALAVAITSLVLAAQSKDMKLAISGLEKMAIQAQRQADNLQGQNEVQRSQLELQRAQTGSLYQQANASTMQLAIFAEDLKLARLQLRQNSQAQVSVARQARFSGLQESYQDFTSGVNVFRSELWKVRNNAPFDIEERSVVNSLTAQDLEQLREATTPIIAASILFSGAVERAMPLWRREVREGMLKMLEHGARIANCYELASVRALNDVEVIEVKKNLNSACRNLGVQLKHFNEDYRYLNGEMARDLYSAAGQMGAGPIE